MRIVPSFLKAIFGIPSACVATSPLRGTVTFFESLGLDRSRHFFPFNVSENVQARLITVLPYLLPTVLLIAALLMVCTTAAFAGENRRTVLRDADRQTQRRRSRS